ncbi:MAG: NusG domain II-containing protein [Desulfomonile tiedjei]|uniref:NusG domain II-containing protein n=1 Tax=Desulfomonile tiedjei TaxID=2358 RepID=A0A9D6V478_9BACT|nr:NusG domain II-containing protein [Desulfomonile tiedjei]
MTPQLRTTTADKILIGFLFVLTVSSFFFVPRWVLSGAADVEIRSGEKILGRYSLSEDRILDVAGPLGVTSVEIKSGKVRIKSSPCLNKTCIQMGHFGSEGGCLICLPNEVVVGVGKEFHNGLDAVSR